MDGSLEVTAAVVVQQDIARRRRAIVILTIVAIIVVIGGRSLFIITLSFVTLYHKMCSLSSIEVREWPARMVVQHFKPRVAMMCFTNSLMERQKVVLDGYDTARDQGKCYDTPVKHLKATARVVTNVECMNSNVPPMYCKER